MRMTEEQYAALMKKKAPQVPKAEPMPKGPDKGPIVLKEQIEAAGLPVPFREFVFHPSRDWRLDLAWPGLRFAVEIDGMVHRIKGRFLKDIEKHNALVLSGWRHLRVTPRMVETGEALQLVRNALQVTS